MFKTLVDKKAPYNLAEDVVQSPILNHLNEVVQMNQTAVQKRPYLLFAVLNVHYFLSSICFDEPETESNTNTPRCSNLSALRDSKLAVIP